MARETESSEEATEVFSIVPSVDQRPRMLGLARLRQPMKRGLPLALPPQPPLAIIL